MHNILYGDHIVIPGNHHKHFPVSHLSSWTPEIPYASLAFLEIKTQLPKYVCDTNQIQSSFDFKEFREIENKSR